MKIINLIPLTEKYLETVLVWRNAPDVRKNMYTSHEITIDEHRRWFDNLIKDNSRRYFVFEINEKPCGVVGFSEINETKGIASWAFYTSTDASRGTGSLMEYAALNYAFDELNLVKLRCEVLGFNEGVIKLHQKFGFKIEGKIRSGHYDGERYEDIIHMGIFSDEWNEQRPDIKRKLRIDSE